LLKLCSFVEDGGFSAGMGIAYALGDPLRLIEDLQICAFEKTSLHVLTQCSGRPHVMVAVPRILNRLYGVIHAGTIAAPGLKGALARKAFAVKLANFKRDGSVHHALYDRLIMNKIKAVLGGRVQLIGVGAAPLSPDVLEFLQVRCHLLGWPMLIK
jgi:long-chain acyl-CoA synthetase